MKQILHWFRKDGFPCILSVIVLFLILSKPINAQTKLKTTSVSQITVFALNPNVREGGFAHNIRSINHLALDKDLPNDCLSFRKVIRSKKRINNIITSANKLAYNSKADSMYVRPIVLLIIQYDSETKKIFLERDLGRSFTKRIYYEGDFYGPDSDFYNMIFEVLPRCYRRSKPFIPR